MIHRVTRKEGMESVFLWAKGYVDGQGGGSADGISQLTGLRMRALEGPRGSAMIPDPDSGLALPPDHVPGIAPPGDERGQHRLCSNG
jgi:hypothetical protein